jgi:twitching motility protein PilT
VAVVAQRLRFKQELNIRVPECEILMPTHPIKNFIRNREFFKIISSLETGAEHGMWTFQRYQTWLDQRTNFFVPPTYGTIEKEPLPAGSAVSPAISSQGVISKPVSKISGKPRKTTGPGNRIEIEPDEGGLGDILKKLS